MLRAVLLTSLLVILLSGSSAVRAPLVLSATELAGLSARAQGDPVVARWKSSLLAEADRMLAATPEIPAEGGGWYHDYFCPTHARQLVYVGPGRHRCPVDGEILSGPLYDAARRYFVHADNARRVRQLGLAYALSGRIDYASGARQYLLALAERYPDWPLHGRRPGRAPLDGARMFAQTLDEAIQGLALLQGYDLTRDSSVYSSRDRERVETRLFHEMMRTINRPAPGPSNWHTWHNAYLLSAGYALDDATLVRRILDGPWGVREQLQRSVDGDGFWYEGAISYHFFALTALVESAEAAWRHGENLWEDPRLVGMFSAPLALAWPDGRFPALNDSQAESISDYADLYRVAYARTHREEFRYPFFHAPEDGFYAAVYPATGPRPREVLLQFKSQNLRAAGLSLLRNPRIPQDAAILKYGPHGGSHGHFDKLSLLLFCGGRERLLDPGTVRYGVPSYTTWYKTTLAHNTLVVDGQTQLATTGRGLGFGETPAGDWARAACDTAYSTLNLDRTVFLGPDFLIDVFRVDGDEPHTYDLAYHIPGNLTLNVETASAEIPLPTDAAPAYQHLANLRMAAGAAPWKAEVLDGTSVLRLWGAGEAQTLYCADAPGVLPTDRVPIILVRRQAASTVFVHLLDWSVTGLPWDYTVIEGDVTVRLQPAGERVRYVFTFPRDPGRALEATRQ